MWVLSSETLSQKTTLCRFRHGTSIVKSVGNDRPTTVASLSHEKIAFVYDAMYVAHRVAQLRRLRLAFTACVHCSLAARQFVNPRVKITPDYC